MSARRQYRVAGERQNPLRAVLPFNKALVDQTGGQEKVFRRDYLRAGPLPVIDQGSEFLAGFTDNEGAAYKGPLPVLLFGDHTRVFKYVDFPFALGADGIKVLQPRPWYEPKFLYYFLLGQHLPSRGYSRHFKLLRQTEFPFIPRSEQIRIVELLDQADRLRRLRSDADGHSDRILPALLNQLIGNPRSWSASPASEPLGQLVQPISGGTPSKSNSTYWKGDIPWASPKDVKVDFLADSQDHISSAALEETNLSLVAEGSVLIVVRGMILARDVPLALSTSPVAINQDMKALVPKSEAVSGAYVWAALNLAKPLLRALVRTAGHGTRKLDTPDLMNFPIPRPDSEQLARVESIVEHRRREVDCRKRARRSLDGLFSAVMRRAFDGSLTSSWRASHMTELLQEMEQQVKVLDGA